MKAERVFCILDAKGRLVSAWPRIGVAKIHCRVEMKDSISEAWLVTEVPKDARSFEWYPSASYTYEGCSLPRSKPAKKAKRGK